MQDGLCSSEQVVVVVMMMMIMMTTAKKPTDLHPDASGGLAAYVGVKQGLRW